MQSDKDFIKTNLGNEHVDAESNFTILSTSHVKADINLGSLGDVTDNMNVTVDSSSIDQHLKVDGLLLPPNISENLVLVETSKGLILSVADGSTDGLNFGGNSIATIADENGRPILTTSLQASIFSQIQQVGVLEENQRQVYENDAGHHMIAATAIFTDSHPTQTESQHTPAPTEPEDQKKKRGGGWPKGKKRKPELDFKPPKKPMTGYVLFALKRRQEIKADSPELQFHVITKILGQEWTNMAKEEKETYGKLAEEDKERYIREMQEFQNSDTYQAFVKNKKLKGEHIQGITDSNASLLDLEDTEGISELYCKLCNQYFISTHNKKEHMFGRQHLQNITSEIQKDIDKQTAQQKDEMMMAASLDGSNLNGLTDFQTNSPKTHTQKSASLDLFGFVKDFMDKNGEREHEIHLLRRSRQSFVEENLAISKQMKELEAYESKLDQDLESLKAYGASLTAQVNTLKMVPTLFGVINF